MSFTPCDGITKNITINKKGKVKGFEQVGGIVDRRFVERIGMVYGFNFVSYQMYNGFPIYNPRQSPKPFNGYKVEFNPETNCYKKTVQFYYEGIGATNVKNTIQPLKDNEYLIVLDPKQKYDDYNQIFIGAQVGLHVVTQVLDEETGYWLVTMETEEPASELKGEINMKKFVNGELVAY